MTNNKIIFLQNDNINIPRFMLVTFNDFGPDIKRNVKIEVRPAAPAPAPRAPDRVDASELSSK